MLRKPYFYSNEYCNQNTRDIFPLSGSTFEVMERNVFSTTAAWGGHNPYSASEREVTSFRFYPAMADNVFDDHQNSHPLMT